MRIVNKKLRDLCMLWCLFIIGVSTVSFAQRTMSAGGQGKRFIYTLSCNGKLYKFSAQTGEDLEVNDLSQRLRPLQGDGCPISGVVYTPDEDAFFVLEKIEGISKKDKQQAYAVLCFRLSDFHFQYTVTLPGEFDSQEIPHLELSASGSPQVVTRTKTYGIAKDRLLTTSRAEEPLIAGSREMKGGNGTFEMDLAGYTVSGLNVDAAGQSLLYRLLSNSGSVILIQYKRLPADPEYTGYAAVDIADKKIVGLNPAFTTSEKDLPTLAPGGKAVLFREYKDSKGTDRLALLDTSTGALVLPMEDKSMDHGGVWAITPSGVAVLSSCCLDKASLIFHPVSMGRDFSALPMLDYGRNGKNWYFFSER